MILIYGLFCKETNKLLYIGQTKNTLHRRLIGHRTFVRASMYATELMLVPEEDALFWEGELVRAFNLVNDGLNCGYGGHSYRGTHQPPEMVRARIEGRKGYTHSEETKQRIGASNSTPVICIDTGEVFKSTVAAARWCGGTDGKISAVCKGKRKSHKGYKWKYHNDNRSVSE